MSESASARAWSDHAETYAALFAPLTSYIARGLFAAAESALVPGARCLDIACGTGALSVPALAWAQQHGGHVTATDFSQAMVRGADRALAHAGGSHDHYTVQAEDGQRLSFADATFDAVFSCFGIFLFADRLAGWREAARVLRPGGVFATSVWQGPTTNPMIRAQMKPVMAAMPERLRPTPGAPTPRSWMEISDAGALRAELDSLALFDQVAVHEFHASFAVTDRQRSWHAMQNNPVLGALLRQCTADELDAIKASLMAHFRELAGDDHSPLFLDSICNLVVARRRG